MEQEREERKERERMLEEQRKKEEARQKAEEEARVQTKIIPNGRFFGVCFSFGFWLGISIVRQKWRIINLFSSLMMVYDNCLIKMIKNGFILGRGRKKKKRRGRETWIWRIFETKRNIYCGWGRDRGCAHRTRGEWESVQTLDGCTWIAQTLQASHDLKQCSYKV